MVIRLEHIFAMVVTGNVVLLVCAIKKVAMVETGGNKSVSNLEAVHATMPLTGWWL